MLTFLSACKEKPQNPVAVYGDAMINSYEKGKQAGDAGNLDAVKKALAAYRAINDKYPAGLDEIKPLVGQNLDISKYDYDPQSGSVTLKSR
ncbi:MAG: hypothetical protein C0402_13550 [Thermodesulfovibrio sp.]|nr:hypothetical protein [Thermodesulfovibrio sp.]